MSTVAESELNVKVLRVKEFAHLNGVKFTIEYSADLSIYQPGQHKGGTIVIFNGLSPIQALETEAHELFHAILEQHYRVPVIKFTDKHLADMAAHYGSEEAFSLDDMFCDNINNLIHHSIMLNLLYPKFDIPIVFYRYVIKLNFEKHIMSISDTNNELYSFIDGIFFSDTLNTLNDQIVTDKFNGAANCERIKTLKLLSPVVNNIIVGIESQQLLLNLNKCLERIGFGQNTIEIL
ncbi:MAG: hypothetical protein RW306_16255 [Geobacteraceae bacterium]|nr:hypothetical protein [Geobacteraceae bacterium]